MCFVIVQIQHCIYQGPSVYTTYPLKEQMPHRKAYITDVYNYRLSIMEKIQSEKPTAGGIRQNKDTETINI